MLKGYLEQRVRWKRTRWRMSEQPICTIYQLMKNDKISFVSTSFKKLDTKVSVSTWQLVPGSRSSCGQHGAEPSPRYGCLGSELLTVENLPHHKNEEFQTQLQPSCLENKNEAERSVSSSADVEHELWGCPCKMSKIIHKRHSIYKFTSYFIVEYYGGLTNTKIYMMVCHLSRY